jgi:hypothetical protein
MHPSEISNRWIERLFLENRKGVIVTKSAVIGAGFETSRLLRKTLPGSSQDADVFSVLPKKITTKVSRES